MKGYIVGAEPEDTEIFAEDRKPRRRYAKLFLMAFAQVFIVSAQTYMIAKMLWVGIVIGSFMLNYLWCCNVCSVHASSQRERLVYSSGACIGALLGVWIVSQLING